MHCTHTVWNYIYVKQIDRLQDKEIICNCLTKKHSVYFLSCDSLLLFSLPGYDMSTFIRRYSRYLNEKAMSYRLVAVDFTKMKRGQGSAHTHTHTNRQPHSSFHTPGVGVQLVALKRDHNNTETLSWVRIHVCEILQEKPKLNSWVKQRNKQVQFENIKKK